jgi:hypothetical protein
VEHFTLNELMLEEYRFYPPEHTFDTHLVRSMDEVLAEISNTLRSRADGVSIKVYRSKEFPQLSGRDLITRVEIEIWDCAA